MKRLFIGMLFIYSGIFSGRLYDEGRKERIHKYRAEKIRFEHLQNNFHHIRDIDTFNFLLHQLIELNKQVYVDKSSDSTDERYLVKTYEYFYELIGILAIKRHELQHGYMDHDEWQDFFQQYRDRSQFPLFSD